MYVNLTAIIEHRAEAEPKQFKTNRFSHLLLTFVCFFYSVKHVSALCFVLSCLSPLSEVRHVDC